MKKEKDLHKQFIDTLKKRLKENKEVDLFLCPKCNKEMSYLNIGRSHWLICDSCKIKSLWGSNIISSWRYETKKTWQRNLEKIKDYKEIK